MKLLIVDDEVRTRELLSGFIPWEELEIDEVKTARNGIAALELAREWIPDVVLCDVRMPKMNGIEFATHYRELAPASQIIFLSGFSDKEYLKSAINLKALTYIEKPINLEEVREAVASAVKLVQEDRKKRAEEQRLQAGFDSSLPFLRQEMVRKLITVPDSPHVLPALQSRETFLLPQEGPYTTLCAALFWNDSELPDDPTSVQERLLLQLNADPLLLSRKGLCGFDSFNWLVLIVPGAYGSSYREGREAIDQLIDRVRELAGSKIQIPFGIGVAAKNLEDLPQAYKSAFQAGQMQYYTNGQVPIFAETLSPTAALDIDWEANRRLREHLKRGELQEARSIIQNWTLHAYRHPDSDLMRLINTYFQYLLTIMDAAAQEGITEQSGDAERRYIWREIHRRPNLKALEEYVLSFLEPFSDLRQGGEESTGKLREIVRYIHAHFPEKGFTIRSIADNVGLSETYLCSYFKKQRGTTIKEYITEVRLERAKELLREKELKLFEVAVRLGFADANYFTTFFKRASGMTPTEYREKMAR
ncbi:helix-turn-helix domain-containing protein [Cohnella sp. AR92]|uniref:helix-turn-helix domain-containing protein n=1 Tax=Cohnella sp. AR92 TaxID=648716 RepID=UPI000F8C5B5C|nr:helix-turn-helix domain-containing protein [Cohnella sp. AR92]RUS45645.1 response regulator [Cohnella sp. AR92]